MQKIKSIRWVSTNGWLVKTGISNLRADVVSAPATNVGFEDLDWTLPASHPDQDSCGGIRQANFDPNLYFVRANTFTQDANIEVPTGYHWVTKAEYIALFTASTVSSKNDNILSYFKQCGLSGYPQLNGQQQITFLFKNGGITGIHAGHIEPRTVTNMNTVSSLAGYVLYRDDVMPEPPTSTTITFEDLDWTLLALHPAQDTCGGVRQANFDPNVYFVRANTATFTPDTNIEIPTGYHWITKAEYIALFNASIVSNKHDEIYSYYRHCGILGYPNINGQHQYIFLFKDGGTTGVHAGHYERVTIMNISTIGRSAGYMLYKD